MYNLFNENISLAETERILDLYLHVASDGQKLITTVPLSLDDVIKLKDLYLGLNKYKLEDFEATKLSLVVMWTYLTMYDIISDHKKLFKQQLYSQPQHHLGFFIDLIGSVFEEYAFATFGYDYFTEFGQLQIIDLHQKLGRKIERKFNN